MASPGSAGPGRGRWWSRGRRRLWLGIGLFAAGLGLGLALYPYPPLPSADVDTARTAFQEARREAAQLAPGPIGQAAASAILMERLYAYDRSRWFRFTRLEALDQAILDTQSFAAQALSEARRLRSDRLARSDDQRRQLEIDLALMAPDVKFLPPRETGARSAYARAGLALDQAELARRKGDLTLLETSLKSAQSAVELARKTLGKRYERFNSPQWREKWQAWTDEAVAASRGGKATIVVDKLSRRLYLLRDGRVAASFNADLGRNALADKVSAGDGATPEGRYRITEKRANGATQWYKALLLDYPNAEDWRAFEAMRKRGEVTHGRGPGGLIEIHGHGGKDSNWTDGCVALQNTSMDRLFAQVPVGTPVTIVGVAQLPGVNSAEIGTQ